MRKDLAMMRVVKPTTGGFLYRVKVCNTKSIVVYDEKEYNPKSLLRSKFRAHKIYREMGIVTPTLYLSFDAREWLSVESKVGNLVKPVIIKPDEGVGGHGVISLNVRKGQDVKNALPDYIYKLTVHFARWEKYKHWIVEELMNGAAGDKLLDFKFYCFRGLVPLVLVKKSTSAYRWFDCGGRAVDTGRYASRIDKDILLPKTFGRLVAYAGFVSRRFPFPFCRVDLYDTSEGVVLGEVTPQPGRAEEVFNNKWESILLDHLKASISIC